MLSWQRAVYTRADPGERMFGLDLLEVEVLNRARAQWLLTLLNTYLGPCGRTQSDANYRKLVALPAVGPH
jgi:hypothetical protein